MKAIVRWTGGMAGVLLLASVSWGQYWIHPVSKMPVQPAPDARGPGFYHFVPAYYAYNCNTPGTWFGPNYCLYPPFQPFQGIRPPMNFHGPGMAMQQPAGPAAFPTHPFVRGPRDFFMFNENLEDTLNPDLRPALIR